MVLLLLASVASVFCDEKSDEEATKAKRAASIGSYSYSSTDFSKFDENHAKTSTIVKKVEATRHDAAFSFDTLKRPMGKTTVEYWPPDMNKHKFYSMTQQTALELWPKVVKIEKPETLPDIPYKMVSPAAIDYQTPASINYQPPANIDYQPPASIDYQPLTGPTESVVLNTDPGPVVFPTLQPTVKSPDRIVAFVARGGSNKKRKLKKKVKPEVAFVETSPDAMTPATDSVIEITASNQHTFEATPVYETIDEPMIDFFKPIRYTDVVDQLSNLTQMSFGMNGAAENDTGDLMIEIIDNSQATSKGSAGDTNFDIAEVEADGKLMVNASEFTFPSLPRNFNKLAPIDRLLNQLKRAIDERDIAKIKNIVEMLEEPKPEATSAAATEAATTATSSSSSSFTETITDRSKIYLAPRVRIAQKKLKQLIAKSSSEKLKENISVTEMSTSAGSSTKLKSTTEKMTMMTAVTSSLKPANKKRSHITTRIRKFVTSSSRPPKSIRRRIGRKPA